MLKQNLGKIGEDLACEYLVKNKYRIIGRNYRTKWDEIDIISKAREGTLVFVEVKTLKINPDWLVPEDNMTAAKLRKISRACQLFVAQKPELINENNGWRIDLVAISLAPGRLPDIRHYENI